MKLTFAVEDINLNCNLSYRVPSLFNNLVSGIRLRQMFINVLHM